MNLDPDLGHTAIRLAVNLLLLGSSVAAGLILAFRLTRSASPRARYLIAVAAFLTASLMPMAVTFYAVRDQDQTPPATASAAQAHPARPDQLLTDPSFPAIAPLPQPHAPAASSVASLDTFVDALAGSSVGDWFLKLWLIVAGLLLSRQIVGHFRLAQARHSWPPASMGVKEALAWPEDVPLYLHEHAGPSTIGLLRPAVVLPEHLLDSLPPAAVVRIARHELSHARWRDPLVNAALRLVRAVLWPSIPLWFLERIVRAEREASADRAALRPTDSSIEANTIAVDYAASLVLIAAWSARRAELSDSGLVGILAGNGRGLEDRIRKLLEAASPPTRARLACASAALLAGLCGMNFLPAAAQPAGPVSARSVVGELKRSSNGAQGRASETHQLAVEGQPWLSRTRNPLVNKIEAGSLATMTIGGDNSEAIVLQSSNAPVIDLDSIPSVFKADGVDRIVEDEAQEKNRGSVTPAPAKSDSHSPETQSPPGASGKWKYLGQGIWQDPLVRGAHPDAPKPWKDLGNGFWDDGDGRRVAAHALPAWVYLGEGKWYTPKIGDWMKNLDDAALAELGIKSEGRHLDPPDSSSVRPESTQPRADVERKKQQPTSDDQESRIVNRQVIKIVNR